MHKTRAIEMGTPETTEVTSTSHGGLPTENNIISTENNRILAQNGDSDSESELHQSAKPVVLNITYVYDCEENEEIRVLETLKVPDLLVAVCDCLFVFVFVCMRVSTYAELRPK
jgi:hypothetical protein